MTTGKIHLLWNMAAMLTACASFVSCSQDGPDAGHGEPLPPGSYPLALTARVDDITARSTGKDAWTAGDEIGVRIGADGIEGRYSLNADGSVLEAVKPAYWLSTAADYVKAWYPFGTKAGVDIADQSGGFADFDFLAATAENRSYAAPVDLTFRHLMAKVSCTLRNGHGVTADELAEATVRFSGYTKVSFAEGELKGEDDGWITPATDMEALLVPRDMTGTPLIKVSIGGSDFCYTPDDKETGLLEPGRHNAYTITVTADGIEVTEAVGAGWTESDNEDVPSLNTFTYKTDLSTAKVGDLITASGKLIDVDDIDKITAAAKKQVVGVVFWTPSETDPTGRETPASLTDDKIIAAEHPDCTHGLAVAVKNVTYNGRETMQWELGSTSVQSFQDGENFTHHMKQDFVSIASGYNADDNINRIYGYQNTVVIRAFNEYCTINRDDLYIVFPVAALDEFQEYNPAPTHSTGWFLPSAKELHILAYKDVDNIRSSSHSSQDPHTRDKVNSSLETVGDVLESVHYWSSSECAAYADNYAFTVDFNTKRAYYKNLKSKNSYKVRAVCAF